MALPPPAADAAPPLFPGDRRRRASVPGLRGRGMRLTRANLEPIVFAGGDDRPGLDGLRVETDGRTVATNGHVLVVVGVPPQGLLEDAAVAKAAADAVD